MAKTEHCLSLFRSFDVYYGIESYPIECTNNCTKNACTYIKEVINNGDID